MVIAITGILAIYTALTFFGIDFVFMLLDKIPLLSRFAFFIRILLLILFNLLAAKLLEHVEVFREIGKNTLYLCGNEFITTTLFICFLAIFGFTASPVTPLSAYIYTSILLFLGMKLVIPLEKNIVKSFQTSLQLLK